MSDSLRRAGRLLLGTFLVYGLLVATHRGEFWPFSIYPMFSQAGDPWSRAVVRDVSDAGEPPPWTASPLPNVPGEPFALESLQISNIDLANFVSKTDTWTPERVEGLRSQFSDQLSDHTLLVMRVNGRMVEGDSVVVEYVPYVYLHSDSTALHPKLQPDAAASSSWSAQ
jgi:hypothetical protein